MYELTLPFHKPKKPLTLETISEKVEDSSNDEDVEKDVAFLAKNFWKFLKLKKNWKSFSKRKSSFKKDFNKDDKGRKNNKWKNAKDSSVSQEVVCYECVDT